MKNFKTIAIALLLAFSTATVSAQTKKVNASKSKISWIGKKVTGQHEGNVNLKEGALVFNGKKLTGGMFTVDMNSVSVTDLKAPDFFGTDKYGTSTIVFKSIADKGNNVYAVTADLTIKDKTNPITFDITVKGNTAATSFKVDRTKYDVKYGSGSFFDNLGDKAISDNFDISANLQF